MTCHDALTLLEEYVDKELPSHKEALVKQHFDHCPSCREELETTLLLKELLKSHKAPDPGETYWEETAGIIKARTVEVPSGNTLVPSVIDIRTGRRHALYRSVISVAASLVILFSALLLGSGQQDRLARIEASRPPVLYSASLDELIGNDKTVYVSQDDYSRLARGMILMGAPGFLGRFSSPINATAISN